MKLNTSRRKKLKQLCWKGRGIAVIFPTVVVLVLVLRSLGQLQVLEWMAFDQFFRWRPPELADSRILIVEIREEDIKMLQRWPMSDQQLVELLRTLKLHQPRAIGLDLYRDLPVPPGSEELIDLFESTPNLIGIEKVVGAVDPPPTLKKLDQVGASDIILDFDGRVRRALFIAFDEDEVIFSFPLKLALLYLEKEGINIEELDAERGILRLNRAIFRPFQGNEGGYVDADAGGYQFLLNYRSPPCGGCRVFETVSMGDVLADRVPPELIRDRIVLVGTAAYSLKDIFLTPYSNTTPGVEVHAQIASQVLSAALDGRRLIRVWPNAIEGIWIVLWSGVGVATSWIFVRIHRKILSLVLTNGSLSIATYVAFLNGWWIPVVPPLLILIGLEMAITAYRAYIEREDRQIVMNLLGQQVSPKIANAVWDARHQLIKEGHLIGQDMVATVLFTDIKGFTRITERTDPKTLMSWLNEYMNVMSQIVLDHDGVVDKFIGDAVMAVFGIPIPRTTSEEIGLDALAAVRCALQMRMELETLNQQWDKKGLPTAAMRVGIATGLVVAGSLGGLRRQNYTTIGDTVNIAARLESYDKSSQNEMCRILISEQTYQYISPLFYTQLMGKVKLPGKEKTLAVYQVFAEI
ncbi:CHASE2 domain-containing protein [Capilliphycus salinus ALCB114379]|uniref:CHASE2 domain-containing protein n=1 Tax=Capilliphycus salinus TaxID=2768948 RepID=UPI0039A67679